MGEFREEGPYGDKPDRLDPGQAEGPQGDLVRQYLREIGRYPLLTKVEEVALAKAIESAHHAQAVLNKPKQKLSARFASLIWPHPERRMIRHPGAKIS